MHWNGSEYVVQDARSFEETARLCGVSGKEVSNWYRRLDELGANKITTVSAIRVRDGTRFRFVQIGFLPEWDAYGFLFARANDRVAQEELQSLAKFPKHPGHRVDALGDNWFYYEGHWGPDGLTFSPMQ